MPFFLAGHNVMQGYFLQVVLEYLLVLFESVVVFVVGKYQVWGNLTSQKTF